MNRKLNPKAKSQESHDEQELIAFHLGDPCDEKEIRSRLESDPVFAELSALIAYTLRIFSGEPIPPPDTEAAWRQVRSALPQGEPVRLIGRWNWLVLAPAFGVCLIVLAVGLMTWQHYTDRRQIEDAGVIHLHPLGQSADTMDVTRHLDRAERWLTIVNHTSAPLDASTISVGDELLANNAVYLRDAHNRGDLPDAVVLERLSRVLTTAHHPSEQGLRLRVEMNTDGLLFDLRVLRQNQTRSTGETQ